MNTKNKIILDEAHMIIGGFPSLPVIGKERTVSSYTDDGKQVQTMFFDNARFNSSRQARKSLIKKFGKNSFDELTIW